MEIILQDKYENSPAFVRGHFSLKLMEGFTIGTFIVKNKFDGSGLFLEIGVWNGTETKTNVFLKKDVQQKIIQLWVNKFAAERPEEYAREFATNQNS